MTWQQEEEDTFEDYIENEPAIDIRKLTSEQRIEYYRARSKKENWWLSNKIVANWIRDKLINERQELEGRNLTLYECCCVMNEIDVALELRDPVPWNPPTQLEGKCNLDLELHCENTSLPYVEEIAPDLSCQVLIDECLDLICVTKKLDDLRVEKLVRKQFEVCFDVNYLCASYDFETEFLMLEDSSLSLQLTDLGDELDVDMLLKEIEHPLTEIDRENSNIVYYSVDGDNVDYFFKTSFEPVVDYIFPPNTFDSHDYLKIKDFMLTNVIFFVKFLDVKSVYYLWAVVCSFAHFDLCVCRRRTKGALAQPFDSYD